VIRGWRSEDQDKPVLRCTVHRLPRRSAGRLLRDAVRWKERSNWFAVERFSVRRGNLFFVLGQVKNQEHEMLKQVHDANSKVSITESGISLTEPVNQFKVLLKLRKLSGPTVLGSPSLCHPEIVSGSSFAVSAGDGGLLTGNVVSSASASSPLLSAQRFLSW